MTSSLWYRVRLRPDQIAAGHVEMIRRRFVRAVSRGDGCDGACLFVTSHETRADRLREDATDHLSVAADAMFFSPASISLIPRLLARYGAEPSEPPDRGRAALLVGEARHWELLPYAAH